jgi:hypothetical protein
MNPWIPNCILVLLMTVRPMVRLRELIRFCKICYQLVPCNMGEVGIRVCRMLSSPITIAIKRA